jgi:hypothetical protein
MTNWTQLGSILGAVLAIIIGGGGILLNWFPVADGMGLIVTGLSILGVHYGGVNNPTV